MALSLPSFGVGWWTPALAVLLLLAGCNPVYVARAGWAQAQILSSRVPLTEVMTDPEVSPEVRAKLRLVRDARSFALEELGFQNVGDSYTTLASLESDTLAMVLSAAYRDRLASRSWWFPVAGRVPYRAYFSLEAAERARDGLEEEGFDTYLRPTAAFSTLGWFADPLYSTLLRLDEVGLVETVLHELAHNHLYLPGHGRFNESYATFVGHVAAGEFFCRRRGGGMDTVKCGRARDRWSDARKVSRFVGELEKSLRALYAREDLELDGILLRRDELYREAWGAFRDEVQPGLGASTYGYLAAEPLNNATFLARVLYFHRLDEFDRIWREWDGDFSSFMAWIRDEAPRLDEPFLILGD